MLQFVGALFLALLIFYAGFRLGTWYTEAALRAAAVDAGAIPAFFEQAIEVRRAELRKNGKVEQ